MGLGNNIFKELKNIVMELDKKEDKNENDHKTQIKEELIKCYAELELLKLNRTNNSVLQKELLNDIEIIAVLQEGDIEKAETKAKEKYDSHITINKPKIDCDAVLCLIFPVDEENSNDLTFQCITGCTIHIRCEGFVPIDSEFSVPEDYKCKIFSIEVPNNMWIEETLKTQASNLEKEFHNKSDLLTRLNLKIKHLEEEDSQCGQRQRELKKAMKTLKINPARYHGGDFEGKSIQEMLNCSRNKKFELLNCISDK